MEEKNYKYMVGVQCMTFNQSKYILDALNGFVMQQTNFPFVIMVVDDASTDGEQDVIAKFISEQFDTTDNSVAYKKETDYAHISYAQHKTNKNCYIVALYLKENLYSQGKSDDKLLFLSEWRNNIKYEALCEGDDYWIDEMKLQKQVDFLEINDEYVMSHTSMNFYYEDTQEIVPCNDISTNKILNKNGNVELDDVLTDYYIRTLTVLYRKSAYEKVIASDYTLYNGKYFFMGDTQLWFGLAKLGKIYYLPEITSMYRRGQTSVTNQPEKRKKSRFALSSAEMRYYISLHYDIREETQKMFQLNYEKNLILYWRYDPHFIPKFPITIKNRLFKIVKYRWLDLLFYKFRVLLGNVKILFQKK